MDRMRIVAGLALSFLLLFPAVSEGKRKKTTSDEDFKLEGSSKHRVVQESMDLSGYGVIDEVKRINLQNQLSADSNRRDVGKEFEVLVEGTSKRSEEQLFGRTSQNKVVVFDRGDHKVGDYVRCRITGCSSATLFGEEIK